jgi:site-specific DNA-methyltransferase (cytosine-N4-specific)
MNKVFFGDCREIMKKLIIDGIKVQTCVTSPPYWGLRDYGTQPLIWGGNAFCNHEWGKKQIAINSGGGWKDEKDIEKRKSYGMRTVNPSKLKKREISQGQWCQKCGAWFGSLGLEPTPYLYIDHIVEIFKYVYQILKKDGTLWLNIGDTYFGSWGNYGDAGGGQRDKKSERFDRKAYADKTKWRPPTSFFVEGLKPKDLCMIPARVALALQGDGWYLRSDIIWHKTNPMPESVKDRPTKSHEYLFLLSKNDRYYYDFKAIKEPVTGNAHHRGHGVNPKAAKQPGSGSRIFIDRDPSHANRAIKQNRSFSAAVRGLVEKRNKRTVWSLATAPYPGTHFATFPPALIIPCILAGARADDIVFDPFLGSGTTAEIAKKLGRQWIGCEQNREYERLQKERIG